MFTVKQVCADNIASNYSCYSQDMFSARIQWHSTTLQSCRSGSAPKVGKCLAALKAAEALISLCPLQVSH